jgi:hypothetical protein
MACNSGAIYDNSCIDDADCNERWICDQGACVYAVRPNDSAGDGGDNDALMPEGPAGCVADGTGSSMGDRIGDRSLPNCNGGVTRLHNRCEESKALWILVTSGS